MYCGLAACGSHNLANLNIADKNRLLSLSQENQRWRRRALVTDSRRPERSGYLLPERPKLEHI